MGKLVFQEELVELTDLLAAEREHVDQGKKLVYVERIGFRKPEVCYHLLWLLLFYCDLLVLLKANFIVGEDLVILLVLLSVHLLLAVVKIPQVSKLAVLST